MDFEEALESLKNNPELVRSLEEALHRKADTAELSEIFVDAGVSSESAETLIAAYQRKCGLTIADDDLDEEELRKVAGGGTGLSCDAADDCDKHYKDSGYWGIDHCSYSQVCDEAFW